MLAADQTMPAPVPLAESPSSSAPAHATHRLPETPAARQLRGELVALAFREMRSGAFCSMGAALVFAIVVGWEMPVVGLSLWLWLVGLLAAGVHALWLAQAFQSTQPAAREPARWEQRLVIATALTALGWGASIWLFPTLAGDARLGVLHVLLLAGLIAASAWQLLATRHGNVTFLVVITAPLAARFLAVGDLPGIALGVCVVVFAITVAMAAQRNHRTLAAAITGRWERETESVALKLAAAGNESRETELREARAHAEAASRAKGDFLATISHEIRTPMNGVLGMLRIVRETALSAEQRDYLKTASDCAEKLLLLLNDVLDFSKIEAGRLELHYAPFPPATAAQTVADLLHARARDKGLQFELQIGDNLPGAILGDAARLRQILGNLIGNAIKFTERGRVALAVACVERTAARAEMHFTVTDTGIGIDSATLERLFKPFTQADTSLSRRYGGAGLGLAISTRLAEAMGGVLQVQSTLNQGTTFRLMLPCRLPEGTGNPFAPDENPPPLVASTLSARVLVVEDDSVNQQVIDLFLKKLGIAAQISADGETAVTRAASQTFDLILMDCQLPGIDGMEATRRIRQKLAGGRPVKIVALTANTGKKIRDECLAAGMDDFLTKPVRFELLAETLQRHLPKN